jgi:DnaJ-class molecular chaperone
MINKKREPQPLKDFYSILGVPKNASEKGIKEAFRKLARRYHPDVNRDDPDATFKFIELAEAYRTLKSKEKRNEVDARIISEYCRSFLGSNQVDKVPNKKVKSEFLRILRK